MSKLLRRPRRPIRRAAIGVLLLALIAGIGPWLWTQVLAAKRSYTVDAAPVRDVALVLGAGLNPDGTPSRYLAGRLDEAYQLYQDHKVKVILVSGDNRTENYSEPEAMRSYLKKRGIPARDVVADYAGLNTYDSCYRARNIFGVNSVTVVTQQYHLPRAISACRMAGIKDAIGVGNEQPHNSRTWRQGWLRELPADIKLLWDTATGRKPILGQKENSVASALTEHDR